MGVVLAPPSAPREPRATLEIGLLNNLGDLGLERGERQILDVLDAAGGSDPVRLHLFSLPSIARGRIASQRIAAAYSPIEALFDGSLDGLIVTGCEPHAARLQDEAYWRDLTLVADWAERHTRSTIWSCLGTHAAVLHLDGIERRRLPQKLSGVFAVDRASDHPLLAGMKTPLPVCHSRYNDLAEADLRAAGYEILSRSPRAGVDSFCKGRRDSLFVFLQGHPEYDADALRREYRRDVVRFLDGATTTYPAMPVDYFGTGAEAALRAFERAASADRETGAVLPSDLTQPMARRAPRGFALALFRNWLASLRPDVTARRQPIASRISSAIRDTAGRAAGITLERP